MVAADISEFPLTDPKPTALTRYLRAIETAALLRYVLALDAASPIIAGTTPGTLQGGGT